MQYVWRDGQRLTPWMLYVVNLADVAFFKIFGLHLLVGSGIRLDAEQETLFLSRYREQATGNGPYGDVRWWRGKRWVLISPDGPVAAPGSSNHQLQTQPDGTITAAVDLRDTGTDPGVMTEGTVRANWLRANAQRFGLVPSGYGFNPKEPWHFDVPDVGRAVPSAPAGGDAKPLPKPNPKEDPVPENKTVDYRQQTLKAGEDAYLEIDANGHIAALAGPATVTGNFYVSASGSPIMVDALAQKIDGKGRPTSTRFISSGTVEAGLPDSIPVDGVLEQGEFLRFRVRKPKTEVKIAHASARLLYWVG